jgi:hypothetical protein
MALHMNSFGPQTNDILLITWGQTRSVLKVPIIGPDSQVQINIRVVCSNVWKTNIAGLLAINKNMEK